MMIIMFKKILIKKKAGLACEGDGGSACNDNDLDVRLT